MSVFLFSGGSGMSLTLSGGSSGETFTPLASEAYGVSVAGGAEPYTYQWSLVNPYGQDMASSLMSAPTGSSGTYTNRSSWAPGTWVEAVLVTDSTGATARAWRTLNQPGPLASIVVVPPVTDYFILDFDSSPSLNVVSTGTIGP